VHRIVSLSFRDASEASGPGIQMHISYLLLESGFAPAARPGMTENYQRGSSAQ